MQVEKIFESAACLLLMGILALACVMIILAMCAVASDADDNTDRLLNEGKEKEDVRE